MLCLFIYNYLCMCFLSTIRYIKHWLWAICGCICGKPNTDSTLVQCEYVNDVSITWKFTLRRFWCKRNEVMVAVSLWVTCSNPRPSHQTRGSESFTDFVVCIMCVCQNVLDPRAEMFPQPIEQQHTARGPWHYWTCGIQAGVYRVQITIV